MHEHPLRRQVVGEMHLRRWPDFALPCLIVQWVRTVREEDRRAEVDAISAEIQHSPSAALPTHLTGQLSADITIAWERHSEGSTLTVFMKIDDHRPFLQPAVDPAIARAIGWAEQLPGEVIRATRILAMEREEKLETVVPLMAFSPVELVSCHLKGYVRLWSDFRLQPDGYGRLLVASNGLDRWDFIRLVQRLQELGNYRNRALLGLPAAKEYWPLLDRAESQLQTLTDNVANGVETDDALMGQLSALSLELMAVSTAVNYRMSATAAYAALVEERLVDLECSPIPGFSSLSDFTQRRFQPAVRTCAAFSDREKNLSIRVTQITSLLRARIETRIENQNGQLLRSMEKSASMQLRLQQLVEGLSVVALSYYIIGLTAYLLKGAEHIFPALDAGLVIAALVLPVATAMWGALRLLKGRFLH